MTPAEYIDPARFPLTTKRELSAHDQVMLDAASLSELWTIVDRGQVLDDEQSAQLVELENKVQYRAKVLAALLRPE